MHFIATIFTLCMFYIAYSYREGGDDETKLSLDKRSVSATAEPNCPYSWTYVKLNQSVDRNNNVVRIAQNAIQQWFQIVHCDSPENESCPGMNNSRYYTKCKPTQSLYKAFVCNTLFDCESDNRYAYIRINTSCSCHIKEREM